MITSSNPESWIDLYGDELYRYALSFLGKESDAEDAVQETLLSALGSRKSFSGNSLEKTWLFGILKHKIADHFRRESRYILMDDFETDEDGHSHFLDNGKWANPPSDWGQPERSLENRQFWTIFGSCLKNLSPGLSRVFSMKALEDRPMDEICKELDLSTANGGVRMHRARLGLRKCLERHWFRKEI